MTPISEKPFMVINKETEISVSFHKTREEAEKVAKEMSGYHREDFIVEEIRRSR